MVSFSPKGLPPVPLRHNRRWIGWEEPKRRWKLEWFSLLIQLSWCRDGFTRMYLFMGVCQQRQGAIKNTFRSFLFPFNRCISGKSCRLSRCETCKAVGLIWALCRQPLLLSCFFFICFSLGCRFFFDLEILNITAAEWTKRPHCFP